MLESEGPHGQFVYVVSWFLLLIFQLRLALALIIGTTWSVTLLLAVREVPS